MFIVDSGAAPGGAGGEDAGAAQPWRQYTFIIVHVHVFIVDSGAAAGGAGGEGTGAA